MTYLQALVLGGVQGLTEFLPISSSGHLILVPRAFGWPDQGLAFDAVVHIGTLAALVLYFRSELAALLSGALPRRLGALFLVATIPAGMVGLVLGAVVETHLRRPVVVAASTALWAVVMWLADRRARPRPPGGGDPLVDVGWRPGLAVGCAQALALVPGTSRSGITITAALLGGLDRATAARFSFLLGIPITLAAGAVKTLELLTLGIPLADAGPLAAALGAAFASGWFAVWFLVNYLKARSLAPFAAYRLLLAALILAVASG